MAESVVLKTNNVGTGFGTQTYNTAAVSFAANRLAIVKVAINGFEATAGSISLSGGGLSNWVEIDTQVDGAARVSIFRGMSASPGGAAAIQISISGTVNNACAWSVEEWDGVNSGGTDGSAAIKQSAKNQTNGGSPDSLTVTLPSAITAGNAVSAAFACGGQHQTPGSSYTELSDDITAGSEDCGLMSCYHYTGTTTPSTSGMTDFTNISGIAFEVDAAAAGGTTIDLTAAAFGFTAQSVQPKQTVGLTAAAFSFVANAIDVISGTVIDLTTAAFGFVGNAFQLKQTVALTAAAFGFVAQSVQPIVRLTLSAAAFAFTATSVAISTAVRLTAASFQFVGRLLDVTGITAAASSLLIAIMRRRGRR